MIPCVLCGQGVNMLRMAKHPAPARSSQALACDQLEISVLDNKP